MIKGELNMASHAGITEVGGHADMYKFPTQEDIDNALDTFKRLFHHDSVKTAIANAEAESKVGTPVEA